LLETSMTNSSLPNLGGTFILNPSHTHMNLLQLHR
jgi:hypothetical protein